MNQDVIDILTNKYSTFTKTEKKVADYIFSNNTEPLYMSIDNLSEACGVSNATITRFCRRLGFEGYNEFKLSLAKTVATSSAKNKYEFYGATSSEDSFLHMCQKVYNTNVAAITQTLEGLNEKKVRKAVDFLLGARNVYCFGQGGSLGTAMDAYSRFVTVCPYFHWVPDSHLHSITTALLTKEDVILYFSYSGATTDAVSILRSAKENCIKTILITHFGKSPASSLADVVLISGHNENPLQVGSIAAKQAILFLVDVLFTEYCRRELNKSALHLEITAKSLASKHL